VFGCSLGALEMGFPGALREAAPLSALFLYKIPL
jgi:hypothetical protein